MSNWYTSTASAPTVTIAYSSRWETRWVLNPGSGNYQQKRQITTHQYEIRGLTQTCAEDYVDSVSTDEDITAVSKPSGGGSYFVQVTEITTGTWTTIEESSS